jgi:hypothetical protein
MEAAEPASSALRAAAWAATSDGAGATLLAPATPGLAGLAGFFAAGLLAFPLPCVALSLGLGFVGLGFVDFGLELWRRAGGSTTVVASTVTGEPPFDSALGLELAAGAGALAGGALAGGALVLVGGAGVLDVFAGGGLAVVPSGAPDVPEGVSCEPEAGAGGGEVWGEVVGLGSPAASASAVVSPSPERVKPPPASAESRARQVRRRGPLSGATRRARSSLGDPIVVLPRTPCPHNGLAHCIGIGTQAGAPKAFLIGRSTGRPAPPSVSLLKCKWLSGG